ncbi:MAG TPA: hypothetical protein VIN57_06680 [Magnetovibrio sp.]
MYTRHNEVPTLSTWPDKIAAAHYNVVHRALIHRPQGIRLSLPGLKTLELILQQDAWIIVDRAFNDIPVAAWTNIVADRNRALSDPVSCELRFFHGHAAMITKQVLNLMDQLLSEQLKEGDETHQVIAFPQKE